MSVKSQDLEATPAEVTPTEYQFLVQTLNQTQEAFPGDASIVELFLSAVEKSPQATALIWREKQYSYRQLCDQVMLLASILRAEGVGPEVRVGLCMSRCPDMIIAMLAILWVGGAYVPMDPNYPVERLTFIMEDAHAPLLMTQTRWSHLLGETGAKLMTLDEGWQSDMAPATSLTPSFPHQTAYVLFTSGSTGRPKGVQIGHRSVIAMLHWAASEFGPEQRQAVLAATSVCFDLSVFEIFLPLTTGGSVVLAENALDLPNITHPVTLINTVPSAITELWRANQIPASAKTINLAGEPLRRDLVSALYALGTVEKVYNLYGPSEDTTYSTWACIERDSELPPVIGRPLTNTQAYVLNRTGDLVKPEQEGELFLGGDGLARGYLDQPSMTAARFLPDPFAKIPGARVYKTGDLVRYRASGDLDFLGRLDHQVKIRGFRIELGEIEDCLRRHEAVLATVVVAIRDGGDPQLAAYIERPAQSDDQELRKQLREHLGSHLPSYMVPAFMVPMDALPQTPNGKVDRKKLPKPGHEDQGRTIAPPRNDMEQRLAKIWREALGFQEVGIFEDFFDLGGDSIRALRIVTQARKAGLPLKTMDLFKARNIAALATNLPQSMEPSPEMTLARLDRASTLAIPDEVREKFPAAEAVWPATAMQESMLFQTKLSDDPTEYADVFHFTLNGAIDVARFARTWQYLTDRHFALRTVFQHMGDYFLQIVLKSFKAPYTFVPQKDFPSGDVHLKGFISDVLTDGFQTAEVPPWKVFLLQESADRFHFVFMFHHVILDGWSLAVLFRECSQLQTAPEATATLQPTIPFNRFLNWYQDWDQSKGYEYWRKRLENFAKPNAVLPLPKPGGAKVRTMHILEVPEADSENIRQFARKNGLTLNTLIQGAWSLIITRYSRSADVIFGNSGSGRSPEIQDVASIVGLVLQTVVTRIQTDTQESLLTWLHQIQEQHHLDETQAFCPLVEIQKELGATQQNPLFESMIAFENYAGNDWPEGSWAGVQLESIREREEIHFGLLLQVLPKQAITLKLHADQRNFEEGGSLRMLQQVALLLASMPTMADKRPQALPLLPSHQTKELLQHSETGGPQRASSTMLAKFEEQAARTPDATAVVCRDRQFSYAALNQFAENFANHLHARDLSVQEPIGLCLERDPWLLVAYFGIMKAGGIIVPIDPKYPNERKQMIAEDAHIRLLVGTAETWSEDITIGQRVDISIATQPIEPHPHPVLLPQYLSYIIYTSGSTGKPKGVAIPHDAYINHQHGFAPLMGMNADDRVLQFSSHTFDMSINEIFMTLYVGGTVVIEPHRHGLPPDVMFKLCMQQNLTVLMITTGFWRTFCEQIELAGMRLGPQLRLFITGGERMVSENLECWARVAAPETILANCYGPTETTVIATAEKYLTATLKHEVPGDIPIGRPSHGYDMHIMSPTGPTPLGVPGELMIGGDSLARCYFGKPALTAMTYVPHHASQKPGARLYKTGDLIRFNPAGQLMFVDRIDRMVKVRGFRIELGEIEFAMRSHEQISDALVLNEDDPMGGQRLIAFVVPVEQAGANTITAKDIHAYLDGKLPHFMLPSAYALLDEFPVTLNGKLDKKALPRPEAFKRGEGDTLSPQSQTQKTMAEIWRDVLKLERVGISDNFFDLGGHSLSALAVHQRMQRAFERTFPLVKIFEHPNITSLAAYLDKDHQTQQDKPLPEAASQRVANRRQALRKRRRS